MTKIQKKIALGLAGVILTLGIAFATLNYVKIEQKPQGRPDSTIVYTRHYSSGRELVRNSNGVTQMECKKADLTITVTKDSVFLSGSGKPTLEYAGLGVDQEAGLHVLRPDSLQVIFYKYKDKRDTTKHILLMVEPGHSTVFFELPTCPETEK